MIPALGVFGLHKFILGYTKEGIIQLIIGFVTCGAGSIIGLIEGLIYLTKSDEDFVRTYIQNRGGGSKDVLSYIYRTRIFENQSNRSNQS